MIRDGGVDATIIQPTIVYGPFSGYWTERPAAMLTAGVVILPAPGDGICNAVYVDDVVQALILAAQRDEAAGESFLVSGPEHPTWLDFYHAYEKVFVRNDAVRLVAYDEIDRRNRRTRGIICTQARARLVAPAQRSLSGRLHAAGRARQGRR